VNVVGQPLDLFINLLYACKWVSVYQSRQTFGFLIYISSFVLTLMRIALVLLFFVIWFVSVQDILHPHPYVKSTG